MTDREPDAPPVPMRADHLTRRANPASGVSSDSHQESAPRGDGPPMPLTLATRTHGRPPTDTPTPSPAADPGRSWLARLFAGDLALPPVTPALDAVACRSVVEADAAARALGCPDLFVIDTPDRGPRERFLADLARAAALRSERVLVLSPDPHAADHIAELAATGEPLMVVRALSADESPHRRPPATSRLTSFELGHNRVERHKREDAIAVSTLEAKLHPLAAAADALGRMAELVARATEIETERDALAARRDTLDAEVRGEVDTPFAERATLSLVTHEEVLASAFAELTAATAAHNEKAAALAVARQYHAEVVADATKKSGFFSRLLGKSKHHGDPKDLEKQVHDLDHETKELADREAKRLGEHAAAVAARNAARDMLIAAEVETRRADLDARITAASTDREKVGADFRDQISLVFGAGFGVVTPDAAAVDRVSAAVRAAKDGVDSQLATTRHRLHELTRDGSAHARRLLADARLVVGTPGSLDNDPVFDAVANTDGPPFGLLVLDRAEQLAEPDFVRLSHLADRWVLAGDAAGPDDPRNCPVGTQHGPRHLPRPTFAARLARLLDREPWAVEGDRLVFRLSHLTADQRRTVTREPLLDHPQIELRVAAGDSGQGLLAEVAFPAHTAVAVAKQFLFQELNEVLLRPLGGYVWHRADDRLSVCWPAAEAGATGEAWVELEPGVREKVIGAGPAAYTAAVAFDTAAGWDAEKAEAWLADHLPAPSVGRLAVLPRSPIANPPRAVGVG